jgi:hypothetical protein
METHMTLRLAVPITLILGTLIAGYAVSFVIYNASTLQFAG